MRTADRAASRATRYRVQGTGHKAQGRRVPSAARWLTIIREVLAEERVAPWGEVRVVGAVVSRFEVADGRVVEGLVQKARQLTQVVVEAATTHAAHEAKATGMRCVKGEHMP